MRKAFLSWGLAAEGIYKTEIIIRSCLYRYYENVDDCSPESDVYMMNYFAIFRKYKMAIKDHDFVQKI